MLLACCARCGSLAALRKSSGLAMVQVRLTTRSSRIKSRVGEDGFVQFDEELKRGDKVVIRDGPLTNLVGVFDRELEDGNRVLMLLTAISYQGRSKENCLKKNG